MTKSISVKHHLFHPFTIQKKEIGKTARLSKLQISKAIALSLLLPIISLPLTYLYTYRAKKKLLIKLKSHTSVEQRVEKLVKEKFDAPKPAKKIALTAEKSRWIGLPNFKNNLNNMCWMNSAIKLLAISGVFSEIKELTIPDTKENAAALKTYQKALSALLKAMQNRGNNAVEIKTYKNYIQASAPLLQEQISKEMGARQVDAYEYILLILEKFGLDKFRFDVAKTKQKESDPENPAAENPIMLSGGKEGRKLEKIDFPNFFLHASGNDLPLDLGTSIELKEMAYLEEDSDPATKNFYHMHTKLVSKPKSIILNVNRTSAYLDSRHNLHRKKMTAPILLGLNGNIPFNIYDDKAPFALLGIAEYCPKAAIVHSGSGNSIDGGHYYLVERTESGNYFIHNDNNVESISKEQAELLIQVSTTLYCTLEKFTEAEK